MTTHAPPIMHDLPYLTRDLPPVRAAIKRDYEDFYVKEIPAYEPCGAGDHCYFMIEKRGLSTMQAVKDIAQALGVTPRQIGMAGLKDARAVSVQTLSLEHVDPTRLMELDIPRIRVLSVTRHGNKLKIGHLRGNRFRIRLREMDPHLLDDVRGLCDVLHRRGVPNYFGQQRFGLRGDTWEIGRAILRRDAVTAIELMVGRAGPMDTGDVLKARRAFDEGRFAAAARAWPYVFRDNSRVCRIMAKTKGRHARAIHAVDVRMRKFFVSAYQSYLFNRVLAQRIDEIDQVHAGDLAFKHDSGAVFRVEDETAEASRAAAFEISPTGPIFGYRMSTAEGAAGELEKSILEAEELTAEQFRLGHQIKCHGGRRPLRFCPAELELEAGGDDRGPFVELRVTLPAGCYATMLLREICKDAMQEGLEDSAAVESAELTVSEDE